MEQNFQEKISDYVNEEYIVLEEKFLFLMNQDLLLFVDDVFENQTKSNLFLFGKRGFRDFWQEMKNF
ncbi:TPA: hypothetical protein DIC40_00465 [Patescibacteria group bacterium]|nr:hypothetical protein [Candidatus Gracilibacteria bacterium]